MGKKNITGFLLLFGGLYMLNYGVHIAKMSNPMTSYYMFGHFTSDAIGYAISGGIIMVVGMILILAGFRGKPIQ